MLMCGSEKFRQVCNPRFPARAQHPDSQEEEEKGYHWILLRGQASCCTSTQLLRTRSWTALDDFLNPSGCLFLLPATYGHGHHPDPIVLPLLCAPRSIPCAPAIRIGTQALSCSTSHPSSQKHPSKGTQVLSCSTSHPPSSPNIPIKAATSWA